MRGSRYDICACGDRKTKRAATCRGCWVAVAPPPGRQPVRVASLSRQLYVFAAPHAVKVGITTLTIEKRRYTIENACGQPVTVAAAFDCGAINAWMLERDAHDALAEWRTIGEWFALPADQAVAIVTAVVEEVRERVARL